MKVLVVLLVLFIMFVTFGIMVDGYLGNSAKTIQTRLDRTKRAVQTNDWGNAAGSFDEAKELWSKNRYKWGLLTEHKEIDAIDAAFERIAASISTRDRSMALAETKAATYLINHIPRKEKLSIENIL